MLLRVGAMTMITGCVFMVMSWLDPFGPLVMILGASCGAIALEARWDLEPDRTPVRPSGATDEAERLDRAA